MVQKLSKYENYTVFSEYRLNAKSDFSANIKFKFSTTKKTNSTAEDRLIDFFFHSQLPFDRTNLKTDTAGFQNATGYIVRQGTLTIEHIKILA